MWFDFPKSARSCSFRPRSLGAAIWLPIGCFFTAWLITESTIPISKYFGSLRKVETTIGSGHLIETLPTNLNQSNPDVDLRKKANYLKAGKTSSLRIQGTIRAELEEKTRPDGMPEHLLFVFDWIADSLIEQVEGGKVVELRKFRRVADAQFLASDPGRLPEQVGVLDLNIEKLRPRMLHVGLRQIPMNEACKLFDVPCQPHGNRADQAFLGIAPLNGKTVRLTHRIGAGIESIEPVDGELSQRELYWLRHTSLTWHHGEGDVESASVSTPINASLDEIMPTTLRLRPRWSEMTERQQEALFSPRVEELEIDFAWTENRASLAGWLPAGHFLGRCQVQSSTQVHMRIIRNQNGRLGNSTTRSGCDYANEAMLQQQASDAYMPDFGFFMRMFGLEDSPDLVIALLVLLVASVVLFNGGVAIAASRLKSSLVALATVCLMFAFLRYLHGQLKLVEFVPFSGVIVLCNWLPLGAALLSGLLFGQAAIPLVRRLPFTASLLAASSVCRLLCDFTNPDSVGGRICQWRLLAVFTCHVQRGCGCVTA